MPTTRLFLKYGCFELKSDILAILGIGLQINVNMYILKYYLLTNFKRITS